MTAEAYTGWYLVMTKPRQETVARDNLERQGFYIYLPFLQTYKHRRHLYQIVTEPLFPRYLFIRLNSGVDDWSKIRSTRGCLSLVRFGQLPARVPDQLITQLQQNESTRAIEDQEAISGFKPGDKVRILEGVLSDYEGIIELKSKDRVTLLLSIAEEHTCRVKLSVHQVEIVN